MTAVSRRRLPRPLGLYPLLATLLLGGLACASRYSLDAQGPAHAAQAKLWVKVNSTDNREIHLDVEHLAPPARIDPAYRAYAVWINAPGHGITKAGVLSYDEEHRRGRIVATTPHAKFEVLVSLERDASATVPSQQVVLRKLVTRT